MSTVKPRIKLDKKQAKAGELVEVILVMRDVSERQAHQHRLEREATTDSLTGLANRRAFDETLAREWARAVRADTVLSLILLDVDHFKPFNDHYGFHQGDHAISLFAALLRRYFFSEGDFLGHVGDDDMRTRLNQPAGRRRAEAACSADNQR